MRKNFIRSLAVLLVIFSLMGTTAFAESAVVTGNAVNFRSGPGTDYQVLDTLIGGTVVEVTGRSGNWCAVSYNGKSGYMSAGYLSTLSAYDQQATVSGADSADSAEGSAVIVLEGEKSNKSASSVSAAVSNAQAAAGSTQTAGEPAVVTLPASSGSAAVTLPAESYTASSSEGSSVIILADGSSPNAPAAASTPVQTSAAASNVGKSGMINMDFVCLRSGPSGSYSIISSYNKGKELVISGEPVGGWTPCVIDNRSGYVYTAYITLREQQSTTAAAAQTTVYSTSGGSAQATTLTSVSTAAASTSGNAYITGNNVRLRSGPSMSSAILGELFYGNSVTVTGSSGDWTAVTVNGKAGYVYSQYVKSSTQSTATAVSTQTVSTAGAQTTGAGTQAVSAVSVPSTGSATGKQIAEFALQFVGYRYLWGGMSPETGFDCSGFVKYVYSQFGYTLNRVAGDQASNGVAVDINALQPGDVLCFYSSTNYIGHTGIYIGNNKFVHASTSTTGVIISELSGYYTDRGYIARRIV